MTTSFTITINCFPDLENREHKKFDAKNVKEIGFFHRRFLSWITAQCQIYISHTSIYIFRVHTLCASLSNQKY